jgi:hypothetical protein
VSENLKDDTNMQDRRKRALQIIEELMKEEEIREKNEVHTMNEDE